ncbi:MAG: deoxyribonuclease IV [Cytophagaceae bacterium]
MLLGVHCSIAGGYENAFEEARNLGIDTFQIFTKNQRQWKERIVSDEEGKQFKALMKKYAIKMAFSHATYLINLSSNDENIVKNSILALAAEVIRCEKLGLKFVVLHPGSSKEIGEEKAIKKIVQGLQTVLNHTEGMKTKILLENTAGQGSSIGWKFEHLMEIMDLTDSPRIGMCLDTCHAFAAGYDIRTKTGFDTMIGIIDKLIGLKRLHVIHMNDSKTMLGSRVDRHEHIGKGFIGRELFGYVMKFFPLTPKVLETSKEDNMDKKNLEVLRAL